MGFRDFTIFNKALLAKQVWRIWSQLECLVAKIMEAKYFPGGTILEASVGRRPSYAWRSIIGSRNIVKEGLVWQVGNGKQVRIWNDSWIPQPTMYQIHSIPRLLYVEATVDHLIDKDTKWWDTMLLENLFDKEEVRLIQSIPLSSINQSDTLIWRGTTNGLFSVRSAYYIQQELEATSPAKCSHQAGKREVWRDIWALPIPNVEKNFLWRACHNLLPTRSNLFKKKIVVDPLCPLCGAEAETGYHILWDCPSAKACGAWVRE